MVMNAKGYACIGGVTLNADEVPYDSANTQHLATVWTSTRQLVKLLTVDGKELATFGAVHKTLSFSYVRLTNNKYFMGEINMNK
ncbi:hypothetical protein NECAME_18127, partial [Necator americanus]